jgi:hypothetical protein
MQNDKPERPTYPFPPIGSGRTLARILQCSVEDLARIEESADRRYRVKKKLKTDGTARIYYDARSPLKAMQARIKCLILKKVAYPSYLMGGLSERDYVRNATVHAGARVMVNEDISRFFPSTSSAVVFDIWRHFFRFPDEVARTLTRLTTRKGELPQGAKTSSYLSNLVFWSMEPAIVAMLRSVGFEYTRFIDDVTISSKTDRSSEELFNVFAPLVSMIKRHGLMLKRSKHRLVYAGQRMETTGLVVGERSAGLGRTRRSGVRALVYQCEASAQIDAGSPVFASLRRRAASLVGQYSRLHPGQGQLLKQRLKALSKCSSPPVV